MKIVAIFYKLNRMAFT